MNLFYVPEIKTESCFLSKEESQHCVRVLRMHEGEQIHITDGKGNLHDAVIQNADPKHCEVRIINTRHEFGKRDFQIHLAVAPTKNISRMEWLLEKATEIGLDKFTPLICRHSERQEFKKERIERVVVAAMKQSQKAYLPWISKAEKFEEFVSKDFRAQKFIAYIDNEVSMGLKQVYKTGSDVQILIGPEGDFSQEEIKIAKKAGFIPINLGGSRLRTETAALYACFMIHCLNTP